MATIRASAVSDVGLTRSNNQDSGYAGRHIYLVADGMGGHAGGDVASAIVVQAARELDVEYASPFDAERALRQGLIAAGEELADTVASHPELTGMGTTVSGIAIIGDSVVIAHIGDSRIYRFRGGEMRQMTSDHTFVQRLVETGRITAEEAAHHPKRSVLMRVLGDVDAIPEIDTAIHETRPGDRWLLCSDGLSSYVDGETIYGILDSGLPADQTAAALLRASFDAGAPDNVTIVVVDVMPDDEPQPGVDPVTVGAAAKPLSFAPPPTRRQPRLPALLLHPFTSSQVEATHFEPETDAYLAILLEEDRKRLIRRRVFAGISIGLAAVAVVAGVFFGYRYTQSQYYVAEVDGRVALFQGVQAEIFGLKLSSLVTVTDTRLSDLPRYRQDAVRATISAGSLERADEILKELENAAR